MKSAERSLKSLNFAWHVALATADASVLAIFVAPEEKSMRFGCEGGEARIGIYGGSERTIVSLTLTEHRRRFGGLARRGRCGSAMSHFRSSLRQHPANIISLRVMSCRDTTDDAGHDRFPAPAVRIPAGTPEALGGRSDWRGTPAPRHCQRGNAAIPWPWQRDLAL